MKSWFSRHGWWLAIAAAYLYLFPHFPEIRSANELPRIFLVRAMADDQTFQIDRYVDPRRPLADISPSKGHHYSNKAPGSSMLVVPFYWAVSTLSGPPSLGVTMWICRVVTGVIPAILFLALLARFLAQFAPDANVRRLVLVAYALGSMAMTYSLLFIAHQLAAVCVASAWIFALDAAARRRRPMRTFLAAGFLAGCGPLVDYQTAFALVPLGIHIIYTLRTWPRRDLARALGFLAVGAAVPIAILLAYHAACFGSPWRTGYNASETFAVYHQQGFLGITKLRSEAFWGTTFGAHFGLFTLMPWLLLVFPGAVVLWRRGMRDIAITCVALLVIYVLFISSINFWRGGWSVGPRYITIVLPFLLPPIAAVLQVWRDKLVPLAITGALILVGITIFTLATATFPYWPESIANPFHELTLRMLGDHLVAPNAGTWVGLPALLSLVPIVAIAGALLGRPLFALGGVRAIAISVGLAFGVIGAYRYFPATAKPDEPYGRVVTWVRAAQP